MNENLKPKTPRLTYISFLECELRGSWENWVDEATEKFGMDPTDLTLNSNISKNYRACEGCELWFVRQDGLRTALSFKSNEVITIFGSTIRFYQEGILEELTVNHNE